SSSNTTITPPTAAGTRLSTSKKGKQLAKASKAKSLTLLSEVAMTEVDVQASATVLPFTLTTPTLPPPTIPTISQVPQAPTPPTIAPSTFLQDLPNFSSLFGFDHCLKTLKANFSEFVQTNQFAGAVSSIPGIVERYMDQRMNEAVKRSYAMATDLSEIELKKIPIEKMESNKDTVTLKRSRDDADKDEVPSAGSDRGSKRRREGKEPESTSAPKEKATKTTGKSTQGSKSYQKTASKSAPAEEPMQKTQDLEEPSHQVFKIGAADDQPILEASQHPEWSCKSLVELEFFLEEDYKATTNQLDWNNLEGQRYPHNLLKPLPLIPNSRGLRVIPFDHFINNDLEYLRDDVFSHKYTTFVTKTKAPDYGHIKWIEDLVPRTMWSQEPVSYDKYALWGISRWGRKRQWCRKLPKEAQPHKAGYVPFELKRKEAYTANSNPRGFIYQNKDKQNRLMRIDELHKFNDVTLNDVRIALDDRLKDIWMKYLAQAIDKQLKTRRIMRSLE
nr:hypothetical protein [Tanacetum cinerariifolium]